MLQRILKVCEPPVVRERGRPAGERGVMLVLFVVRGSVVQGEMGAGEMDAERGVVVVVEEVEVEEDGGEVVVVGVVVVVVFDLVGVLVSFWLDSGLKYWQLID